MYIKRFYSLPLGWDSAEYKIPYKQERYPEHGSTISVIENGIKREMLMFDKNKKQFIPMKNERIIDEIEKWYLYDILKQRIQGME